MATEATLADGLVTVYRYWCLALVDDHEARKYKRDLGANTRGIELALRRIGPAVAFLAEEPTSTNDRPWAVATVDPATGAIRFDAASAEEARAFPSAEGFDWRGEAIG